MYEYKYGAYTSHNNILFDRNISRTRDYMKTDFGSYDKHNDCKLTVLTEVRRSLYKHAVRNNIKMDIFEIAYKKLFETYSSILHDDFPEIWISENEIILTIRKNELTVFIPTIDSSLILYLSRLDGIELVNR
ncbi:hypothetical protein QTP88_001578 [Uroleucon formosanum]